MSWTDPWALDVRLLVLEGAPLWVAAEQRVAPRLWVSRDDGRTWTLHAFPTSPRCASIVLMDLMTTPAAPGRLWATLRCDLSTTNDVGLVYSDDGGGTWTVVDPLGDLAEPWLGAPIGSATDARLLFRPGRVWRRSDDGGAHWTRISVPTEGLLSVSPDNSTVLLARDPVNATLNFSSIDGGQTWQGWHGPACSQSLPAWTNPGFVRGAPDTLVIACYTGEVYRSADLGQTWTALSTVYGEPRALYPDDAIANRLFAFVSLPTVQGLHLQLRSSPDSGATWQERTDLWWESPP